MAKNPNARLALWDWVKIALMVGVLIVIAAYLLSPGDVIPVSGEVVGFTPLDEANLNVEVEFSNEGDVPTRIACTVTAYDASRGVGFDILSTPDEVPAHDEVTLSGSLRIEDEGAFRVVEAEATDCEPE